MPQMEADPLYDFCFLDPTFSGFRIAHWKHNTLRLEIKDAPIASGQHFDAI